MHFVNENVGGHATFHVALRQALLDHPDIDASFFDAPPRRGLTRLAGARFPGLAGLDLDLQPLRDQLVRAAVVRSSLKRSPKVDVLHGYTQNAVLLSVDRLRRQPTVVSTDTTNTLNASMLPQRAPTRFTPLTVALTRPIENRVFRSATIVVAHTEWAARSIEQYGVPVERIRVIPFGITVADPLPYQADRPRITFVGGSLARKGGRRLLDVWRRHLRDRADLTMVTIEKVAAERGLEVRNDLRPGDPALLDVLARTTVLAFPSEVDTFGYAAIEAMACGVPVVTTRCGGLPEVVVDEVTGLLVDVGDDLALRHALERILGDPALRQRMGAAARERVLERFDATNTTTALVNVLREACELGPPRPSSW